MEGTVPLLVLAAEEGAKALQGTGADDAFVGLAYRGAVAMLLGLLLGAEREYAHSDKEALFAGVRTFPLISLLGFVAALFGNITASPMVFALLSLAFGLMIVATYVVTSLGQDKGATTEIAGLTAYFLGALCFHEEYLKFASALAVAAAVLLSMREAIHGVVARIEREDVHAALKLAIVTLIVLPLLKDKAYGPYDAFNPRSTWTYVVFIAAISFAGYVAVKVMGASKGIVVTGLFGGLASSTAVALAFSRKSKDEPALSRSLAGAIVLASTITFPKVLAAAVVAYPPLFQRLWKPMALLTAVGVVASVVLQMRGERGGKAGEPVAMKNPFELGSAVKFGLLLAAISFVSRAATAELGAKALYLVAVVFGLGDADGFATQAGEMLKGEAATAGTAGTLAVASTSCILAALANTVVKGGLTVGLGAKELRAYTVPAFGVMILAGAACAFLFA